MKMPTTDFRSELTTRISWSKIYKYPLEVEDVVDIPMPEGAQVLCVQTQGAVPCLWARVDTRRPNVTRRFFVVGTGHPMPIGAMNYIGTFQLHNGGLVFHVFE